MKPIALLLLLLVPVASASAQRAPLKPIDTDRPDFTDGTATVPRGHSQFELGYLRTSGRLDTDMPRRVQSQAALLRFGFSDRAEFRVSQEFVTITPNTPTPRNLNGFDDVSVGTKIALGEQHGAAPSVSIELGAALPTGGRSVAARKFLPNGAVLLGWEGSGPWSAGVEVAGERIADDRLQGDASVSIQYAASTRVQLYGEWYTFQVMPLGIDGAGEHYLNGGVLYRLSGNAQLDASFGAGLSHDAARSYFGFGFSFRR